MESIAKPYKSQLNNSIRITWDFYQ